MFVADVTKFQHSLGESIFETGLLCVVALAPASALVMFFPGEPFWILQNSSSLGLLLFMVNLFFHTKTANLIKLMFSGSLAVWSYLVTLSMLSLLSGPADLAWVALWTMSLLSVLVSCVYWRIYVKGGDSA